MEDNLYTGDLTTNLKKDLTVGDNLYNDKIKGKTTINDSIDTTTVTLFSTIDATIDLITVPINRSKTIGLIDTTTTGKKLLDNVSLY